MWEWGRGQTKWGDHWDCVRKMPSAAHWMCHMACLNYWWKKRQASLRLLTMLQTHEGWDCVETLKASLQAWLGITGWNKGKKISGRNFWVICSFWESLSFPPASFLSLSSMEGEWVVVWALGSLRFKETTLGSKLLRQSREPAVAMGLQH